MKAGSRDRDAGVVRGLCFRERREDLKKLIREVGFWRLPIQRRLAERYEVTQQQISKDLRHILTTVDDNETNEVFTEFYNADKKSQNEIRKILNEGTTDEKLRAIMVMINLQRVVIDLLERCGRKKVNPVNIKILESKEKLYDDRLEKIYQKYYGKDKKEGESEDKKIKKGC